MEKSKVKIVNMESSRGNIVPNQFIIYTDKGRYFQSYASIICFISTSGETFLDAEKWDYSRTTSKFRNNFLGESSKETAAKIKSGEYKLINLN